MCVGHSERRWDGLHLGTFVLWAHFFAFGLLPEESFRMLRDFGHVATQQALVNSSLAISLSLSLYFAFFAYRQCREAGLSFEASQARAVQAWVLGLVAFLPLPLSLALNYHDIPVPPLRYWVLIIGVAKLAAWFYLFALICLRYLLGMQDAFAHMASIFPSSYRKETPKEDRGAATSDSAAPALCPKENEEETSVNASDVSSVPKGGR